MNSLNYCNNCNRSVNGRYVVCPDCSSMMTIRINKNKITSRTKTRTKTRTKKEECWCDEPVGRYKFSATPNAHCPFHGLYVS